MALTPSFRLLVLYAALLFRKFYTCNWFLLIILTYYCPIVQQLVINKLIDVSDLRFADAGRCDEYFQSGEEKEVRLNAMVE